MAGYAILVNTCDGFEDCWDPFFTLFARFWPGFEGTVYLNTERKDYAFPGLSIVPLKVCRNEAPHVRPTWSECLIRALDAIPEELLFYVQEDYFLNGQVQEAKVAELIERMRAEPSIHCIHFNDQALAADGPSPYPGLYRTKLVQRFRISCQTALWRRQVLRSYVRSREAAWQFELYGSLRARHCDHNFYVVDPTVWRKDVHEMIPYVATGIVQGRWYEAVPPLFAAQGIGMDFTRRGFLSEVPPKPLGVRACNLFKRLPIMVASNLELTAMAMGWRPSSGKGNG